MSIKVCIVSAFDANISLFKIVMAINIVFQINYDITLICYQAINHIRMEYCLSFNEYNFEADNENCFFRVSI